MGRHESGLVFYLLLSEVCGLLPVAPGPPWQLFVYRAANMGRGHSCSRRATAVQIFDGVTQYTPAVRRHHRHENLAIHPVQAAPEGGVEGDGLEGDDLSVTGMDGLGGIVDDGIIDDGVMDSDSDGDVDLSDIFGPFDKGSKEENPDQSPPDIPQQDAMDSWLDDLLRQEEVRESDTSMGSSFDERNYDRDAMGGGRRIERWSDMAQDWREDVREDRGRDRGRGSGRGRG
ncbi:unnamed protein product, partial [Discosporangium mesarthrocarpum]